MRTKYFMCQMCQDGWFSKIQSQFVTDLKTKAQTCEFKDLKDSLIRDQIVCGIHCGIHCDKTRSRLLREPYFWHYRR